MTTSKLATSSTRTDIALTILRVTTGTIFAVHGAQKLFVYGFDGVAGAFAGMGVPFPGITGPMTGFVELFGGLALIVGLLSRLAGFGLAMIMLGAISMVHLAAGFFVPNGVEFPLSLLAATLAISVAGAGRFSLDAAIARRRSLSSSVREIPRARAA